MKKILFLSPDAHMGGSQILLLNLAKALQQTGEFEIEFLLKNGGELKKDFESVAKTYFVYKPNQKKGLKEKINSKLFKTKIGNNIPNIKWEEYDAVLSNTITNGDILGDILNYYKGPILSYIHELKISTQTFSNSKDVANVIDFTDHFLVPCKALSIYLESTFEVPGSKITILPYYFPPAKKSIIIDNLKAHFIVGGIGTTDWRKAPDIFIQIAARCKHIDLNSKLKFVWKGSDVKSLEHAKLQYDIDKLGLSEMVFFEQPENELDTFLQTVDIFLLTSREDPYPLVVLQAANHDLPVICFKDSGGIPEFVASSNGGISVGYLNIDEAATAVLDFYNNPDRRKQYGNNAKKYLLEKHQDISRFSKSLSEVIEKIN